MFKSTVSAGRTYGAITIRKDIATADADGFLTQVAGQKAIQLQQEVHNAGALSTSRSTGFSTLKGANTRNSKRTFLLTGLSLETTVEDVLNSISENPDATLYQVMSVHPILTDGQQKRVDAGPVAGTTYKSLDDYANQQALRESAAPHKLILTEEGEVQYRAIYLDESGREDEDERDTAMSFVSAALQAEVAAMLPAPALNVAAPAAPVAAPVTI